MTGRSHPWRHLVGLVVGVSWFLAATGAFATTLTLPIDTDFPEVREGRPVKPPGLTEEEQRYLKSAPLPEVLGTGRNYDYDYNKENYNRTKMLEAYLIYLSRITDKPTSTTPVENRYNKDTLDLEWRVSRYCGERAGGEGEYPWFKENAAVLSRFVRNCPKNDKRYVIALFELALSLVVEGDAPSSVEVANEVVELNPKELHPEAERQWKNVFKKKAEDLVISGLVAGQNQIQAIVNLRNFEKRAKGMRLKWLVKKKLEEFEERYLHEIAEIESEILNREGK